MPLTGPSSLETALARIVGEPASSTPAGTSAAGNSLNLAPLSALPEYQSQSLPSDYNPISYDPEAFPEATPTTRADLGAIQSVTEEAVPYVAPVAAPVASAAAPTATATAAAAPVYNNEPEYITKQDLANRQVASQQENYMQNWNNQIEFLRNTGAYKPSQLEFKTPTFAKAPDYGKYANDLVSNPYRKVVS